jgi:hypothetical protein
MAAKTASFPVFLIGVLEKAGLLCGFLVVILW